MPADGSATLRLPGIGWLLQWRGDGFWRDLNQVQYDAELDGSHVPDEEEWVPWSGIAQPQARGGDWGGVVAWWLIYGERPGGAIPSVALADGTRPPVLLLGQVWACEWRAVAQTATVHVEGEQFVLPFSEPFYRRQSADASEPAPQAQDSGWFGNPPPGESVRGSSPWDDLGTG